MNSEPYPPGYLTRYLAAKGREFKTQSGQDIFKVCPVCTDEKAHFYVDPEKNVYFCHKCQARGNTITLKRLFNDMDNPAIVPLKKIIGQKEYKKPEPTQDIIFHQQLFKNQGALDYLKSRGFKAETITHFKLGYTKGKMEWITVPYYENGQLVNFKYRSLPPHNKTFKRHPDAKSILFNRDCIPDHQEIVITEGEFDAMMCWQQGIKNVVSGINGANSFDPEWIDDLQNIEKFYIWYDNDDAGRKGAGDLIKRLGENQCWNILEDGFKDANEYFLCHESYDFKQAKQTEIANVIHFWDSVFKIFEHEKNMASEIKTPWKNVNRLIGNVEAGDLITLSAVPKTGKTTLALNIATYNAKKGKPVLFYCLEMRPERLAKKVLAAEGKLTTETFTKEKAVQVAERIYDLPLYFGYNFKNINTESIFATIREATKRYGIKLVVFDNLHFLVRSLAHTSAEVGIITRGFKLLAEELHLPLVLIAQPRKVQDGDVMTMNDLKDSSSIGADSDQVIILWRKKTKANPKSPISQESSFEPKTLVRVDASRFTPGGDTFLYCKGDIAQFTEVEG